MRNEADSKFTWDGLQVLFTIYEILKRHFMNEELWWINFFKSDGVMMMLGSVWRLRETFDVV